MEKSGAKAYLVNTGWNGTGKRISIRDTRGIIDAILDGSIAKAPTKQLPFFNFEIPTELPGVDPKILDPRDTYAEVSQWEEKAKDLAQRFVKNFAKYEGQRGWKGTGFRWSSVIIIKIIFLPRGRRTAMIEGEPDVRFSFHTVQVPMTSWS